MWPVAILLDRAGKARPFIASTSGYQIAEESCALLSQRPLPKRETSRQDSFSGEISKVHLHKVPFSEKLQASVDYTNPEMWRERNVCTCMSAQQAGSMSPGLVRHTQQAGRRERQNSIIFHISPVGFGCCERDV